VCDSPLAYTASEKDTAFIVRACNAFDAMLRALKWQEMAEADPAAARRKGYFDRARDSRRAALAAAKGVTS
jgi:hypothetical protein